MSFKLKWVALLSNFYQIQKKVFFKVGFENFMLMFSKMVENTPSQNMTMCSSGVSS